MNDTTVIILDSLPKISLNEWYAGKHWSKRKQLKDTYKWIVKSQYKGVFSKNNKYRVHYHFYFKTRPLDALNCSAMIKIIEDIIFEDDKWDIIEIGGIKSRKSDIEFIKIIIETL